MKLNQVAMPAAAIVQNQARGVGAVVKNDTLPKDVSELDQLIGPEPPLPDASVLVATLKGAAIGAAAGAAIGYGTRFGFDKAASIPQASYYMLGGTLAATGAGAFVVGKAIEPAFDPQTSAAVGAITTMGFTVISSTLGLASGTLVAALYGGAMGGALGLAGGMLHSQAHNQSQGQKP